MGHCGMEHMENFSLIMNGIHRTGELFPPVSHIAYNKQDFNSRRDFQYRQTVNFGIVLSSPERKTGYRIDGQSFECPVPAFVFTCPGPRYAALNGSAVEKMFFSYPDSILPMFEFFRRPDRVLIPFRNDFNLAGMIHEIFQHCKTIRQPGSADRIDACCMRLVQEIQLSASLHLESAGNGDASAIYPIASYLDLHFAENPDMEEIAQKYGMSYRSFLRKWNRLFDKTPAVYLRERQLEEARRLLEESDLKIYEIAARTGFADPYYFMRFFHSKMNCTPNQYRRLYKVRD